MPPPGLTLKNLNPANLGIVVAGLGNRINERALNQRAMNAVMTNAKKLREFLKKPSERGLNQRAMNAVMTNAKKLLEFLKKPEVLAVLLSAGVSFAAVFLFMAGFGFGSVGIGASTLAAAFQSAFYGGLTPAGSLFATLQSMGMLGTLLPLQVGVAGVSALVISAVVWFLIGRRE